MKVLHIVPNRSYGGIQRICNFLETSLSSFCVESKTFFYLESLDSSMFGTFYRILPARIFKWLLIRKNLLSEISEFSPDVIVAHNAVVPILIPCKKRRMIFVIHGPILSPEIRRGFDKLKRLLFFYGSLVLSERCVCVSKGLKYSLPRIFVKKVAVIHNPPSKQAMVDSDVKRKFDYLKDFKGLKLVQFGRYCYQKNQTFSLDIMAALKRKGISSQLCFFGDGDDYAGLLSRAEELGLLCCTFGDAPNQCVDVVFHEPVNGLLWLSEVFDLALFPSRYEGFSMGVLECLAINLPVLTSDCKYGPSEIYSFFLNSGDLEVGDAKKCIQLLSDQFESDDVFTQWLDAILRVKKNTIPLDFGVNAGQLSSAASYKWYRLFQDF